MSQYPPVWINYPAYERATQDLSLEQRGLLMQLQLLQVFDGAWAADDPERMRRAVSCHILTWRENWPAIRHFLESGEAPWLRVSKEMPEDAP